MADGSGVEGICQLESTDAEEQPDENGTDVDSQWSATSYKIMDIAEPPRNEKRKALAFEIDLSQDLSFQGDGGESSHMDDMNETESTSGSLGPGGDAGSSLSSDRKKREDSLPMEMKSSMISSTDSAKFTIDSVVSKGSNPESASGSIKTVINNKDKDPSRKDKDKEREEKIRQAREKLAEERQRKIDEMKEQQRLAQEKRERQLELRRKKIEELKSREEERRQAVGDRRKKFEETDRAKKEAILQKAKERLTRYEQWKTMGRRKGLAPGVSPPTKQFSFSTSVLYHRQNPEFSSSGTLNISVPAGHAESLMALNTIPENRLGRSFIAASAPPPTRHKSTVTLGATQQPKMRDITQKPRKPRPASVGTSMPSFVKIESESPKSRSKSTDRIAKDKAKPPTPRRKEKEEEKQDKEGKEEAKKPELKKFHFRKKSEEKKIEKKKVEEKEKDKKKEEEEKKKVEEKEKDKKKEEEEKEKKKKEDKKEEKKEEKKSPIKSFFERLSIPKRSKDSPNKQQEIEKEPLKSKIQKEKDKNAKEKSVQGSPAKEKAPVRSVQSPPHNELQKEESVLEGKPEAELGRVLEEEWEAVVVSVVKEEQKEEIKAQIPKAETVTEVEEVVEKKEEMTPEPVHVDGTRGEEEVDKEKEEKEEEEEMAEQERTPVKQKHEVKFSTPEMKPSPAEQKITPKSQKNLELEDYKTKLAEKRRLAREKAEREAELERQRQAELRREEEERIRLEEEEQRRMEEEAIRLEEEARRAEEERLRMAIEAEEQRKREEAERLEAERKSKEDAERKGREEAERLEKERKERAKKEEEERMERKKRLEMIMKRVKVEAPSSASEKTRMESPTRMTNAASKTSLTSEESSEEKDEGSDREERHETRTAESSKFKSPLLQKLVDNKMQNGDSGTPKFKSPILQSIIGKKFGSRSGLDQTEDSSADMQTRRSVVTLSPSQEDLLRAGETEELEKRLEANGKQYTITVVGAEETEEQVESDVSDKTVINSSLVRSNLTVDSGVSSTMLGSDQDRIMDSFMSVGSSMAGSAVSFNGVTSHNGDLHDSDRDLVDSSISMRTVDSWEGSQSGSLSYGGGLVDSHMSFEPHSEGQFEEIIDLNVTNKTLDLKSQQLQDNLLSNTGDFLNLNDIDNNIDNSGFDDSDVPKPIIAFEDNATRRQQDVTDLLS